jgi:hypothetical protein
MSKTFVELLGDLVLVDGTLEIRSSQLVGPGAMRLELGTTVHVAGEKPGAAATVVETDLRGPGDIRIDAGQQLVVGGSDTVVDLSAAGQCNPDPDDITGGTLHIDGSLILRDSATLQNTNLLVRILDLGSDQEVSNNNITLLEGSGGFGGEFFVRDTTTVRCNTIVSEGDRYLDLDPDPGATARPTISENEIYVRIKEGKTGSQGALLELRAADFDTGGPNNPVGASGAFPAKGSAGFTEDPSENWVLQRLEILGDASGGAKLNLTNRQGFEFQGPGVAETLYVKELMLHPNAVLNTALQTLYFEALVLVDPSGASSIWADPPPFPSAFPNGSRILDVPLLGFSLGSIAMDDDTEFTVRIRTRVIEPADPQPLPPGPPNRFGAITREIGVKPGAPKSDGVMEMRTQALDAAHAATSIAAKGAFARVGAENVLVVFEYKFVDNPSGDAAIQVLLSDQLEVGAQLVPLARVLPPEAGRPGSIQSEEFGVFLGTFPRGALNFTRGTYIELNLRGSGARVWIDNWDPQIECQQCADLNGTNSVENGDLLILLSEFGRATSTNGNAYCLDIGFTNDGYVDMGDLLGWDAVLSGGITPTNFCAPPSGDLAAAAHTVSTSVQTPANSLYLAAKPGATNRHDNYIYSLHFDGAEWGCDGVPQHPASIPTPNGFRGDGRLVRDRHGRLYQLHSVQGFLRLNDGQQIVTPTTDIPLAGDASVAAVSVGVVSGTGGSAYGVPLLDIAFDPADDSIVYVVPVLVKPSNGGRRYKAAARLRLDGNGGFVIERLYGKDPVTYSSFIPDPDIPGVTIGYEPTASSFGRSR